MQVQVLGAIERVKFVAYGLAAGLLLGMILGWLFHGFVGAFFRILIIVAVIAPFVLAVIFWQRISSRNRSESIDKADPGAVVVHESRRVRDAGTVDDGADVRDAEWRDRT